MVMSGSLFWGISGTVAQYLFESHNFTPENLVVIRLLFAGLILLLYSFIQKDKNLFKIWKNKKDIITLILFSIFGMLGVQYTYFSSIHYGNAATASILQYLSPVIICVYFSLRNKKLPRYKEVFSIFLALIGTFFIITRGSLNSLSISKLALFFGIASAFTSAIYTVQPVNLIQKYGARIIVGYSMFIGGFLFSFLYKPWDCSGSFNINSIISLIFVIFFGTIFSFCLYLGSLKYITPSEASILGCIEPLSSALLSIIWLKVIFTPAQWFGTFCILITIVILSYSKNK